MADYAILVDFRLKPGARGAFRRLIDDNARASVAREPGCRRFDVLEPKGEDDRIVLYEIYDDRAAFDAHMQTDHFLSFDRDSSDLVAAKSVVEFALVLEGSG
ncbi:putative quinol monooxygenase [Bauldia litoralis]|uniref:Quinol monooxygenase YgiN n=1 Tax=Bauldia litoralis TaxID=665467 RepID=A0A1G6CRM1_9HYPH|nr:putative quinol monooxygenase [Bauldia litoralis]SDB35415.1 Quinol monooxygenase YgiN [Bauldia litoralis]